MRKYVIPTIIFALIFFGLWNLFNHFRKPIIVSTNEKSSFTLDKNYYLRILDNKEYTVRFSSENKFIVFEKDSNDKLDAYNSISEEGSYVINLQISKDQSCCVETGKVECSFISLTPVIYYLYVKESVWGAYVGAELGVFFFVFVIYLLVCWCISDSNLEKIRNGHKRKQ